MMLWRLKNLFILVCCCMVQVECYYNHYHAFGTGDSVITAGWTGGGFNDEWHKWQIECGDGEAMTGVYDTSGQYFGISQVWCAFMFPLKPPGNGLYPYYTTCNVRNYTQYEYYCYDKYYPEDTANTFVTGFYSAVSIDPITPQLQKCCKTPYPYRLDYSRCQWKYTHDKGGEHYDAPWIVKCDTNYVITVLPGTGNLAWKAENSMKPSHKDHATVSYDAYYVADGASPDLLGFAEL